MAREGRFGRLPRTAPNLASVIVAMVREINAQEDANILNAWENGGEYKGRKVTDEMLLRHFRSRRDAISKTDPLYDKWDQAVDNYEFSIAESKMTLKYAQHKVGEGEMAAFYRKWAGKVPVHSEAYRDLMRSAAQFVDAAQARSSAGRAASSQAAYNAAIQNAAERHEKDWNYAEAYLLAAAYRAGILQQTDTTDPDDLMDLRGGDEGDHARFLDLFDAIQNDPYYADIKKGLNKAGLGGLTYGQFVALGDQKQRGIDLRIKIARQFGDESGAKAFTTEKMQFVMYRAKVADVDEFAAYQEQRKTVDDALAQGGLDPYEVRDILTSWKENLLALRDSAAAEEDRGFFNNEIEAMERGTIGPTAFEGVEGGIRTATSADSQTRAGQMALAENTIAAIESGRGVLTLGLDANGQQSYSVTPTNAEVLKNPANGQVIFAGSGNRTYPLYVLYRPVVAQGTIADPRTGRPIAQAEPTSDQQIGVTYTLNGHDYYGLYVEGRLTWFSESPFAAGAQLQTGTDGTLTVSMPVQVPPAVNGQQVAPTFDPTSAIDPRALNPDLQFTYRYDTAMEAVYDRDTESREALLRTSDEQLRRIAALQPDPEIALQELAQLRNSIVQRHNERAAQLLDTGLIWHQARQSVQETGRLSPELQAQLEQFDFTEAEHQRAVILAGGRERLEAMTGARAVGGGFGAPQVALPDPRNMGGVPYGAAGVARPRVDPVTGLPDIKVPAVSGMDETAALIKQAKQDQFRRPPTIAAPLPPPLKPPDRPDASDLLRRKSPDPRLLIDENDVRIKTPKVQTPTLDVERRRQKMANDLARYGVI